MAEVPDPLTAVNGEIARVEAKLKARRGQTAFRDNVPVLERALKRLIETRDMIASARDPLASGATSAK